MCVRRRHRRRSNSGRHCEQAYSTRAEQIAKLRAKVERCNGASRFATAFARDLYGINTEQLPDKDKTHALQRASI